MVLAIYGTGGHAKSIYNLVKRNKKFIFLMRKKFFKVANKKFIVRGGIKKLLNYKTRITKVIVAIGDNKKRKKTMTF